MILFPLVLLLDFVVVATVYYKFPGAAFIDIVSVAALLDIAADVHIITYSVANASENSAVLWPPVYKSDLDRVFSLALAVCSRSLLHWIEVSDIVLRHIEYL